LCFSHLQLSVVTSDLISVSRTPNSLVIAVLIASDNHIDFASRTIIVAPLVIAVLIVPFYNIGTNQ
jgi:hypothetical protein